MRGVLVYGDTVQRGHSKFRRVQARHGCLCYQNCLLFVYKIKTPLPGCRQLDMRSHPALTQRSAIGVSGEQDEYHFHQFILLNLCPIVTCSQKSVNMQVVTKSWSGIRADYQRPILIYP
jgi:hypothetical protein